MEHKPGASPPRKSSRSNYLRYSSLALQLLITMAILGWIGYELDQYFGNKYPLLMLLFGLVGFSGILFKVYRSITKE